MSKAYDDYLEEHIGNVKKGLKWLHEHLNDIPVSLHELFRLAKVHDSSKYTNVEYDAYDDYFYGKEGKDEEEIREIDEAFDYAWLNHIHENKHHWQYWVLLEDEGKTKALEMPPEYVYEMICDWWSFSWRSGNLNEIFSWYDQHKEKMILHPETRKLVESILSDLKEAIDHASESV